jgi:carboxypeptidase Taq
MSLKYEQFKNHLQKVGDLKYAANVLHWDQEVYMPKNGAGPRAQQLATLSGVIHELSTDKKLGDLLAELRTDSTLTFEQKRNVEDAFDKYTKNLRYDVSFVQEMSMAVSEAFQSWNKAKEASDFSMFAPHLEKLVKLKRQETEILGYTDHPYDALLDQFEPKAKTADITALFEDVKSVMVDFVKEIAACPQNDDAFMSAHYDKDDQWDFGIELLTQMGYDFDSGRQDVSSHPFTTNFSATDVRVTTRINENDLNEMIWSCIHEGGHALYEQGLPTEEYGLAGGEYLSLGVHESQSRLWENNVGRGKSYWKANYASLKAKFPEALGNVSFDQFYRGMNIVKPSLIRTNADELTYHFHIIIRFEIEKALIEGSVEVNDLPALWNAKYKEYLDIDVPSDAMGVLQDIHWAHGGFGYFPTYSIGSFYAAQFYATAKEEIPGLEAEIEAGNMKPLLAWLREKVHAHGRIYTADELCERITGSKLNFSHFMTYARAKYSELYAMAPVSQEA